MCIHDVRYESESAVVRWMARSLWGVVHGCTLPHTLSDCNLGHVKTKYQSGSVLSSCNKALVQVTSSVSKKREKCEAHDQNLPHHTLKHCTVLHGAHQNADMNFIFRIAS